MSNQAGLWRAIQDYHPDKVGVALPFSKRLSIENGWSRRYALKAIEEYKKFIFLICVGSHPMTPSESIDQVWHLHLVYSRSYWDDFCGNILKQPLHHAPTEGGSDEDEKYHAQYEQTLEAYRLHFGQEPPIDIWPNVTDRFKGGLWRWVNLSRYWVFPKPRF